MCTNISYSICWLDNVVNELFGEVLVGVGIDMDFEGGESRGEVEVEDGVIFVVGILHISLCVFLSPFSCRS